MDVGATNSTLDATSVTNFKQCLSAQINDNTASPHLPAPLCPPLHDADPFVPIVGTSIRTSHTVVIDVSQLTLDGVSVPHAAFIQHR